MLDDSRLTQAERVRLEALRHAVNDEAATYLAIMRTFTGAISGLLSDQSAAEVVGRLEEQGIALDLDTVDERLAYLVQHGNLARSPRDTEARSIREYLQTRARYQLTPLGELVHRHVEELIGAADAAREVSSEMLGAILEGLIVVGGYDEARLARIEPDEVARTITTMFVQFEQLVESTRDFYTYLSEVLRRFDLDRAEFHVFKGALVGYLDHFVEEIALHMPQLSEAIVVAESRLDLALQRADEGPRLVGLDGRRARRARGLHREDWGSLRAWFIGEPGRSSDARQVRGLATDAMRALLVNLRRIAAGNDRETSRYRDLLLLARWFDDAADDTAHALWAASFGLYSCRHLGYAAAADGEPVPATTSWWSAPAVEVPVSLREHGDRAIRGRAGRRADYRDAKTRRLHERAAVERVRAGALAELASQSSSGSGRELRVSDAAREVLLELYAQAMANSAGGNPAGPDITSGDNPAEPSTARPSRADGVIARLSERGVTVVVRSAPGEGTVISSPAGRLELVDLSLTVEAAGSGGGIVLDTRHSADDSADMTAARQATFSSEQIDGWRAETAEQSA